MNFMARKEHLELVNTVEAREAQIASNQTRHNHMRRIGVFKKVDGEFVGHVATLHFKCDAVIRDNPYRTSPSEPEYIMLQKGAESFAPDLGYGWDRHTSGNETPYMMLHLDDPSFSKTISAVLVKGQGDMYNLFWDRVTITDSEIEIMFPIDELIPYVGVLRPIDKPTDYLISIYESLRDIYDPD